ncbi:MAG: TolC family protein [Prevotellaceae bacterium]|nr:TolC family protein [Prevotellaceae bacterium]
MILTRFFRFAGLFVAIVIFSQAANAQRILTYDDFMKNVCEKNIEYMVEKYNVSIAEANAQAAKVFPDPDLSVAYENNQDRKVQMGQVYSAELGYTWELGGKRRARMAVAHSEQQVTEALVEDFFRNLRADATLCYLEALKQKQLVGLAWSSYQSMRDLACADSLRSALGEIAQVDAIQSRLEAATLMADYFQIEADYKNMLFDLMVFEGGSAGIDSISGTLPLVIRIVQLHELINLAFDNRADLQAAIRNRELSAANVRLAKANRIIDLGLNIGFAHNTMALNEEAYAPKFNTLSAGITIPLKFSNTNRGELKAAQYSELQADAMYNAVLLQIRKEVEQCYNRFISAYRQAELYQRSTLTDATSILQKKKYSYARGETSLLEVLDAQRTANDVFQSFYEALYNANASLVELYRAVGIWDNEFVCD